jgi:hypothetical protein
VCDFRFLTPILDLNFKIELKTLKQEIMNFDMSPEEKILMLEEMIERLQYKYGLQKDIA